jgi:ribonuclease P protein subunit RPR2
VVRAAEKRHHARSAGHQATAGSEKPRSKPKKGFTITQAAEDVVEVIPGSVLLALVGMMALTLMVMLRSIITERHGLRQLRSTYESTVHALATAVEAKDDTTGGHIERVRDLGLLLAREMVPKDARDPQMAWGFLLHDIGKLSVPDAILRKPGRLDDMEWALMRRHAEEGVRILEGTPFLDRALDVVRHHHERWDGTGYPAGLAGEEIPLWARIFSVVDTLDAITSTRPYRPCQTLGAALAEIRLCAGTQFDPAVVEALERLDRDEIEKLLEHEEPAGSTHAEAVREEVTV